MSFRATVGVVSACLLAIVGSAGGAARQKRDGGNLTLEAKRVANAELVDILAYGIVRELEPPPTLDPELRLRLYSVPIEGDCVDGTHYVCWGRYYLAVHTFEELGGEAVYSLGRLGDISDFEWLRSTRRNSARLKFKVANYAVQQRSLAEGMKRAERWYEIDVSVSALSVKALEP